MAKILVTGAAGFIGYHVSNSLVNLGHEVIGLDNINDYYDVSIKFARLAQMGISEEKLDWGILHQSIKFNNYRFLRIHLQDNEALDSLFTKEKLDYVVHLAAQAGVRYSLKNPHAYIDSNIIAFINILEACRHYEIKHLVFASSSSVYGLNEKMPLSEKDNVDHPVSLYAATKKSNELMAHSYSHLYNLPTTGLRFFTVYGPWGRPDMALFLFTDAILKNEAIQVYNYGNMVRDFTYIDDIVTGIQGVLVKPPQGRKEWSGLKPDPSTSPAPYQILNIGNNNPVTLLDFIKEIEKALGKKATMELMEIQPGDVKETYADIERISTLYDFKPSTKLENGIKNFVVWYLEFLSK